MLLDRSSMSLPNGSPLSKPVPVPWSEKTTMTASSPCSRRIVSTISIASWPANDA
jgi:hypothetical protein